MGLNQASGQERCKRHALNLLLGDGQSTGQGQASGKCRFIPWVMGRALRTWARQRCDLRDLILEPGYMHSYLTKPCGAVGGAKC